MMDRPMAQIVVMVSQVYTYLHACQTVYLYSFLYVNLKKKAEEEGKQKCYRNVVEEAVVGRVRT